VNLINRTALIVMPKRPYLDWANTLDDKEPKLDIDAPYYEYPIYLIDNVGDGQAAYKAIRRHYSHIFEHELMAWHRDEKDWPRQRDFRTFNKWFEVKVSSMVIDLSRRPIELEEFDD
jgi:hypothetical protein